MRSRGLEPLGEVGSIMLESCGCGFDLDGALFETGALRVGCGVPMLCGLGATACRRLVPFGRPSVSLCAWAGLLYVCGPLAGVSGFRSLCCPIALVGRPVALVGGPVALIREGFALPAHLLGLTPRAPAGE